MYRKRRSTQHHAELEPAIERDGDADEVGVGLPRARVLGERVGMREDVVGHHDAAGLDLLAREPEQLLVVVLLGV